MNNKKLASVIAVIVLVIGIAVVASYVRSNKRTEDVTATTQPDTLYVQQNQEIQDNKQTNNMNPDQSNKVERVAANGDVVFVHYTGKLTDGKVFDSSIPRKEPFAFILGAGMVIPGWEKGILGMKVGEKKTLTIAPEDGYGARGVSNPQTGEVVIPPNATLIFDVELVDIQRK
jgi:FKBP-type peptidyl-prolyl cis-trans isomerase